MRIWAFVFTFMFMATPSFGQQNFDPFFVSPDIPEAIILNGPIDGRSALSFKRVVEAHPNAFLLVLNSPGGLVQNGLMIAEMVYDRKMSTYIPDKSDCSSACSFVFFAGQERLAEGKLGVHQISGGNDIAGTQLNLSDVLDTLNKYGVDPRILPIMLRTPADDMYYFSAKEMVDFGINRSTDLSAKLGTQSPEASNKSSAVSMEKSARDFVNLIIQTNSYSAKETIAFALVSYADEVDYFGKKTTLGALLKDKQQYLERWPQRAYQLVTDSVSVACESTACRVTGDYHWAVKSDARNKQANGTASFYYILDMSNGIKIVSEGGKARK